LKTEPYGAKVRLKFTIIVNFIMRLLSLFAGLLFTISVTRRLSVEEFGIWIMLFKYISYVLPFAAIFTYWLPRTISRGFNTAKSGVFLSILLGLTSSVIYLFISWGAYMFFNQPFTILLLAAVIVLQEYLYRGLLYIALSHAPQYRGISMFTIRTVQAVSALLLVVLLKLGLYGAVIAAIVGRSCGLLLLFIVNKEILSKSVLDFSVVKKWIKRSWLPLYSKIVLMLTSLDAIIIRIIAGNETPIAYYGVSTSILGIATTSIYFSPALYARLLAKRDVRDVVEAFWLSYLLLTPMIIGIIIYAEPILAVYNIKYVVIAWVVRVFALAAFFQVFSTLLATVIGGLERRDMVEDVDLRETVLFKMPTLRLAIVVLYLIVLSLSSFLLRESELLITLCWSLAYLLRFLLEIVFYNNLLMKEFRVRLPYNTFAKFTFKFLIASIPIIVLSIVYKVEPHVSIWVTLENLLPAILIAGVSYFSILYLIDHKFRDLVRRSLRYIQEISK